MKIGIYPGSFDPIHLGHIKIVNKILEENLVDKVLIVPTGNYWNKDGLTDISERIKMVKIFESDKIIVETKDNNIQATYDLLKLKEKDFPQDELFLIIGGDNVENIDKWINYKSLLEYPFIVVKRNDFNKDYIDNKFKVLNKSNYILLNMDNIDISSSDIRDNLRKGKPLEGLLDKRVFDHIVSKNLYK